MSCRANWWWRPARWRSPPFLPPWRRCSWWRRPAFRSPGFIGFSEAGEEALQHLALALDDLVHRLGLRQPGAAIGFGKFLHLTRARRPDQRKGSADQGFGIAIALCRPDRKILAGVLAEWSQPLERAFGDEAGFLAEFPPRRGQGLFLRTDDPLGDGPGSFVLFCP